MEHLKTVRIIFSKKLRGNWVGDWNSKGEIRIHEDLDDRDKFGVLIHEFIEMIVSHIIQIPECCSRKYNQDKHGRKNSLAHNVANVVEKTIMKLTHTNWEEHEKRIEQLCDSLGKGGSTPCDYCYKKKKCRVKE